LVEYQSTDCVCACSFHFHISVFFFFFFFVSSSSSFFFFHAFPSRVPVSLPILSPVLSLLLSLSPERYNMADEDFFDGFDEVNTQTATLSLGGDIDDSEIQDAQAKVSANPDDASAHAELAKAYFNAENDEDALASYAKAIELDSKNAKYYILKARVHSVGGDNASARELLNTCLESNANDADTLYEIGKTFQGDEEHDKAQEYFRKAIAADANHSKSMFAVANYLLNDEKTKGEALGYFEKVAAVDETNTNAFYHAGQILQLQGNFAKAAEYYTKAVALDPSDAQLRARLIQCYDVLENADKREEARNAMHAEYKAGNLNPSYTAIGRYCTASFESGDNFIMGFDHFIVDDSNPVKYMFMVYKKGEVHEEKVLYRISVKNDGGKYTAVASYPDKESTFENWDSEPSYQVARDLTVAIVKGDAQPK
jgi:tetratricopeptide (TPR) repeat protein